MIGPDFARKLPMHCPILFAIADIDPGSAVVMLLIMAVFGKIFGPHGKIR